MTLVKVQPDKVYTLTEYRLRFAVPADLPEDMVPVYVARDLQKSIENLERFRGCRYVHRIPDRLHFTSSPCCARIALGLPGQEIPIRFEKSDYQGDTDDAHNFGLLSDPGGRIEQDGLIDWVAICHFWEPAVWIEKEDIEEFQTFGENEGFVHPENMPDRTPISQKNLAAAVGQKVWLKGRAAEDRDDTRKQRMGKSP